MTNSTSRHSYWQLLIGIATIISAIAAVMVVPEFRDIVLPSQRVKPEGADADTERQRQPRVQAAHAKSLPLKQRPAPVPSSATIRVSSPKTYGGLLITLQELVTTGRETEARLTIVNRSTVDQNVGFDCIYDSFIVDHRGRRQDITECAIAGDTRGRTAGGLLAPGVTYSASFWFDGVIPDDPVIPLIRLECSSAGVDAQDPEKFRLEWRNVKLRPI